MGHVGLGDGRLVVRGRLGLAARGQSLGEPPVHHLHFAEGPDHDVGRLQVAVDDPVGVGVADRLAELLEDGQESPPVVAGVGAVLEEVLEGAALDQLHGQKRPAVGQGAQFMDGGDARVLELSGDVGLGAEAGRGRRVARGRRRAEA